MPHPVDEERYTPGPSRLREELAGQGSPILFSPARHDWGLKANDRLLAAFAELVRGPAPGALLVLTTWGAEVERSRELARTLGVEERVRWYPPFPKLALLDAYRASDIVCDQFELGTFGGIARRRCAARSPSSSPSIRPCTPGACPNRRPSSPPGRRGEIARALRRLSEDPAERERLGREGRAWVERASRLAAGRRPPAADLRGAARGAQRRDLLARPRREPAGRSGEMPSSES